MDDYKKYQDARDVALLSNGCGGCCLFVSALLLIPGQGWSAVEVAASRCTWGIGPVTLVLSIALVFVGNRMNRRARTIKGGMARDRDSN